jgi:cytochrome c oxidase subunit 2
MDWSAFLAQASNFAVSIDRLTLFLTLTSSVFVIVIAATISGFIVRYRRRSPDEQPPSYTGSNRLELGVAGGLLGLALVAFSWSALVVLRMAQPPADALDIYGVGKMWMWQFQHVDGQTEIAELHLPAGQPVRLHLISQDVIHSFYVPAFRVKQDALPQRYTTLWFQPTKPGTYHLFCAEYCGTHHARMGGTVFVMAPADYEAWLAGGRAEQSPADAGAELFQQLGCNSCHRTDSLARAPQLEGLFGQPVRLAGGATVTADENYIRQSILDPPSQVVEGFEPIMPSYAGQVDEVQLLNLIAYIQSLGSTPPVPSPQTPAPGGTTAPEPTAGAPAGSLDTTTP